MKKLITILALLPVIGLAQLPQLTKEGGNTYINFAPAMAVSSSKGTLKIDRLKVDLTPPAIQGDKWKLVLSGEIETVKKMDEDNHAQVITAIQVNMTIPEQTGEGNVLRQNILMAALSKFQSIAVAAEQ